MYRLGLYKDISSSEMFTKILEEVREVHEELAKEKIDNVKLAS